MIETKILGDAVGIQRGDVIDNSETTVLPSLANGVITGHFKRGRMDKPFKVTSDNYRSLLGYDPSNPSYLVVEDAFKRGIREVSILRVGQAGNLSGGDTGNSKEGIVSFLKMQNNEMIDSTHGTIGGIVYSVNGGAIKSYTEELPVKGEFQGRFLTMYAFIPPEAENDFFYFGRDGGFGWSDANMPSNLDVDSFYISGLNNLAWQELSSMRDIPQPDKFTQGEFEMTVYPASKLPSANIDYDIFDLIIDPSSYASSELAYFAVLGVTPSTKNPDGSYTIKSQLSVVFPPFVPPNV